MQLRIVNKCAEKMTWKQPPLRNPVSAKSQSKKKKLLEKMKYKIEKLLHIENNNELLPINLHSHFFNH
jgi:hypothetical protein